MQGISDKIKINAIWSESDSVCPNAQNKVIFDRVLPNANGWDWYLPGGHGDAIRRNDDEFFNELIRKLQENDLDNQPVISGNCENFAWF